MKERTINVVNPKFVAVNTRSELEVESTELIFVSTRNENLKFCHE